MKTIDYKTSGILEAYLLGLTSDTENQEVEQMITSCPELTVYVPELELTLESQLTSGITPPPPFVREQVGLWTNQQVVKQHDYTGDQQQRWNATKQPADRMEYVDAQVSGTHIQVHKYWRTAFIAVFILGKIFLVFGLYYYFKAQTQEAEIDRLNQQVQQHSPPYAP